MLSIFFGFIAMIVGLRYSAAVLRHFVLRFILYCQGHIPKGLARFLDYATNLTLSLSVENARHLLGHFFHQDSHLRMRRLKINRPGVMVQPFAGGWTDRGDNHLL